MHVPLGALWGFSSILWSQPFPTLHFLSSSGRTLFICLSNNLLKGFDCLFIFFTKAQIGSLTGFNNSHSIDVKSGVSYKCTMLLWCSFIDQRANKSTEDIQGCSHSGEMSRAYHLGRFQHLHCRDPTWKKRITLKIRNPHFSKTSDVPEVMRTHKT